MKSVREKNYNAWEAVRQLNAFSNEAFFDGKTDGENSARLGERAQILTKNRTNNSIMNHTLHNSST